MNELTVKQIVERVMRLNEEKASLNDDIAHVYAEAKATGYDVKALKIVVREMTQDPEKRREIDAIVETYRAALGIDFATRAGAR